MHPVVACIYMVDMLNIKNVRQKRDSYEFNDPE